MDMRAILGLKKGGASRGQTIEAGEQTRAHFSAFRTKLGLSFGVREALGAWDPLFALGKA